MRLAVLVVVFLAFTLWSSTIALAHGPIGFLTLAAREPWAAQMLVDLFLAFFVAWTWLRHDAKARQIAAWPYIVATATLGSIGVLAYLIHRELVGRRAAAKA
ncbi:MAG: hypothetical protein IAE78_22490 [Myxococcus sp.]|nr:hypothetical protein [Myxococcus sp.]